MRSRLPAILPNSLGRVSGTVFTAEGFVPTGKALAYYNAIRNSAGSEIVERIRWYNVTVKLKATELTGNDSPYEPGDGRLVASANAGLSLLASS